MSNYKRLYRTDEGKVLAGVCSGLGEYFEVDPVLIRLLWLFFACLFGSGIIAYLIACLVVSKKPYNEESDSNVHYQ